MSFTLCCSVLNYFQSTLHNPQWRIKKQNFIPNKTTKIITLHKYSYGFLGHLKLSSEAFQFCSICSIEWLWSHLSTKGPTAGNVHHSKHHVMRSEELPRQISICCIDSINHSQKIKTSRCLELSSWRNWAMDGEGRDSRTWLTTGWASWSHLQTGERYWRTNITKHHVICSSPHNTIWTVKCVRCFSEESSTPHWETTGQWTSGQS